MELFRLYGTIDIDDNNAEKKLTTITKKAENVGSSFSKLGSSITAGFGLFAGGALFNTISTGLSSITKMGFGFNNSMQQAQANFTTFLGSAEKARVLLSDLQEIAKNTPYELQDLTKSTQMLINYGSSAESSKKQLLMLGDIAMGSAEKLGGLTMAFGQIQSTGKLTGEDLNQLIERGFNPLTIISKQTGTSMADLKEKMSDGEISFKMVENAMIAATSAGGQFYNSMNNSSKTLDGQLSTFRDNISTTMGSILIPVFNYLSNNVIPNLNNKLSQMGDISSKISPYINQIINGFQILVNASIQFVNTNIVPYLGYIKQGFEVLVNVLTFVYNNFNQLSVVMGILLATMKLYSIIGTITAMYRAWMIAAEGMTVVQWALNAAMTANPIGLVIVAIGALIAIGYLLWQNWDIIVQKFGFIGVFFVDIFNTVKNAVMTFVNMAVAKWNELLPVIMPIIQTIGNVLYTLVHVYFEAVKLYLIVMFTVFSYVFTNIYNIVITAVEIIKPYLQALGIAFTWLVNNVITPVASQLGQVFNNIVNNAISLKNQLVYIFQVMAAPLIYVFQQIMNVASQAGDKIRSVFGGIRESIVNALSSAASGAKSAMNSVIRVLNGLKFSIPSWIPVMGGKSFSMSIPYLAKGGDIQQGGRVIVGEKGAEMLDLPKGARVTPLNKANGANLNININYPKFTDRESIDEVMDAVVRRLRLEGAY